MEYLNIAKELIATKMNQPLSSEYLRDKYKLTPKQSSALMFRVKEYAYVDTAHEYKKKHYTSTYTITGVKEKAVKGNVEIKPIESLRKVCKRETLIDWIIHHSGLKSSMTTKQLYQLAAKHGIKVYRLIDGNKKYLN